MAIVRRVELILRRWVERRGLNVYGREGQRTVLTAGVEAPTFADSLLCAHLSTILHRVKSEINLRYRPLVLQGTLQASRTRDVHGRWFTRQRVGAELFSSGWYARI